VRYINIKWADALALQGRVVRPRFFNGVERVHLGPVFPRADFAPRYFHSS